MPNPMYTDFAHEYDAAIQDNLYNAKFERPSLLKLLPNLDNKKVLDLGCGPGVYAQELIARGAVVTAIDNSEQMIELTRSKIGSAHNAYVQDLSIGLPHERDADYDLVICPLAIHYLANLELLFSDIRRVLKSYGRFVFSTHHPYVDFCDSPSGNYFSTEIIKDEWDTLGRYVPVAFYRRSISAVTNAIAAAGMVIVNISEGQVTDELKQASLEVYEKLSTKPNFMFYECKPA